VGTSMNESDDSIDPRLSALLDGELSGPDADALEQKIDADAELRAEFEALQGIDALMGEWYQALPAPAVATPRPRLRRRWLAYSASIAAAVLLVMLGVPALLENRARTHAEEVIEQAAQKIKNAEGVSASYTTRIVKLADDGTEDVQEGHGKIHIQRLHDSLPTLACTEEWKTTDQHVGFTRIWGQRDGHHWSSETMGDITIQGAGTGILEFDDLQKFTGSPVDTRSSSAARAIVQLLRGFSRHKPLHWMNVSWRFSGGAGTEASPWEYLHDPDETLNETKDDKSPQKIVWTLRIDAHAEQIHTLELEERVINRSTLKVESSQKTRWTIAVSDKPFPDEVFAMPANFEGMEEIKMGEEENTQ
jgi:hypothetical protein